jgi:hypothetical protein
MRSLVQEIRAMNLRQQTQLDMTRVSGLGRAHRRAER